MDVSKRLVSLLAVSFSFFCFTGLTIDNAGGRIFSEGGENIQIEGNVSVSNVLTASSIYLSDGTEVAVPGGSAPAPLAFPSSETVSNSLTGDAVLDVSSNSLIVRSGDGTVISSNTDVSMPIVFQKDMTLMEPDKIQAVQDSIPLMAIDTFNFPRGISIVGIRVFTSANCTMSVGLEEWQDNATKLSDIDIVALSNVSEVTVNKGDITDTDVDAGNYIYVNLDTTQVTWLKITIWYYVK